MVIMGLVMHDAHVDIVNDVVRSIRSVSSNNLTDGSNTTDLIPSSWGRSSATCPTHSEYLPPEMNLMSSSSPYRNLWSIGNNLIEVDIFSGSYIGNSLASRIKTIDNDENARDSSLHATIMHRSQRTTYISIMPIMDVANKDNDSAYQGGEQTLDALLRSTRLTSSYGGLVNDIGSDRYSSNVHSTSVQIVLIPTLMIGNVLDSKNSHTTLYTVVHRNHGWKGIRDQQQRTQTTTSNVYIFLYGQYWYVSMGSDCLWSRRLRGKANIEAVVPRIDGESYSVGHNRFIPLMCGTY